MSLTIPVAEIINTSTNPLLAIDPSWKRVPLGSVAKILNGFAFKSELFTDMKGTPLIRIRDIGNNKTDCYYDGAFDEAYIIKPGDLLVGMDGDFNCSTWRGPKALLNQRVCKIDVKTEQYNRKFLEYTLPGYLKAINENTSAQTVKHLSSRSISEILLPNPPLAEQQRIVARVEALLTHVNAARDRLSRVPLILKKFRQAVLTAACSGRLTEVWRDEQGCRTSSEEFLKQALDFRRHYYTKKSNKKYKEPISLSEDLPFSLPEEWTWATLDQISLFVTDGDHYPPKRVSMGIPHLTSKHVKKWKMSCEECSFISHEDYEIVKVRYEPQDGDVILTCVGTIGETAIVPKKFVFSADRNLAAIRVFPEFFLPQMLQFILNSAPWENHIKTVSGSTAQPHIYLKDLRAMAVPLPPLAEQHEIVRRVNALFERADQIEKQVVGATKRTKALTQAVLGKAFRGELVAMKEG